MGNVRPNHYKIILNGMEIEVKDIMEALSREEYRGFCKMNTLKYIMRADHKNGLEDYEKAEVYLEEIIRLEKEDIEDKKIKPKIQTRRRFKNESIKRKRFRTNKRK